MPVADFDDASGYERYVPHDEHQRVWQSLMQPLAADVATVQFAFQ